MRSHVATERFCKAYERKRQLYFEDEGVMSVA